MELDLNEASHQRVNMVNCAVYGYIICFMEDKIKFLIPISEYPSTKHPLHWFPGSYLLVFRPISEYVTKIKLCLHTGGFSAFKGQYSVAVAWINPSPWSIESNFILHKHILQYVVKGNKNYLKCGRKP